MMRKTVVTVAVAAALLSSVAAQAADLPVKAPMFAPVPVHTWTGWYVGLNAGWLRGETEAAGFTNFIFPPILFIGGGGIPTIIPGTLGTIPTASGRDDSWMGGAQVGYNVQINQIVLGIEADIDLMRLQGSATGSAVRFPGTTVATTTTTVFTADLDWTASLRARVGFAFDRILLYATGGLVVGDVSVGSLTTVAFGPGIIVPVAGTYSAAGAGGSSTRTGWTLGAGLEWAFNPAWSFAAEYRHNDFGSTPVTVNVPDGFGGVFVTSTSSVKLTTDQVTARVNYKFGAR
jgi:outer membrane immunogenic protein